jgi:hypothetical protein
VFDEVNPERTAAISNKTIDVSRLTYQTDNGTGLLKRMREHIDAVANFKGDKKSNLEIVGARLQHVGCTFLLSTRGLLPAQTVQIEAARAHARSRGVIMNVEYAS